MTMPAWQTAPALTVCLTALPPAGWPFPLRAQDDGRSGTGAPPRALYIQGDVRREADLRAVMEAATARHGRIDAVFANAGTDKPPAPIVETDTAEFDDLIATNLRGVFLTMKHALPHLVRSRGALVAMASIGGRHAFRNIVGYGASKAAVIHMARAAAQEYGRDVRINAIAPGAIESPMLARVWEQWGVTNEQLVAPYPMGRVGQPEEVAELVMWLSGSGVDDPESTSPAART